MILKLRDINIFFNKNHFLGPMNASFESGCLNIIVGRSGCGKSTLLKLIAGFHKDYSGEIIFDETKFSPEGNVSLAFQNPEALFFNSNVLEEISYSLRVSTKNTDIDNVTKKWMLKWGLLPEKYCDKYPYRLSGGEKRRVALAACTILENNVILLDEPLAGLDRKGQSDLSQIINTLSIDHIVIVVTHEPEILMQDNTKVFFLTDSTLKEFISSDFLSNAIKNNDFYPLPSWYKEKIKPYIDKYKLPMVNPESVADFIKKLQ